MAPNIQDLHHPYHCRLDLSVSTYDPFQVLNSILHIWWQILILDSSICHPICLVPRDVKRYQIILTSLTLTNCPSKYANANATASLTFRSICLFTGSRSPVSNVCRVLYKK